MAERPDEMSGWAEGPASADTEELRELAQSDDEVEATRAQIELTRAEMTETVDALQERLDPEKLKEQAKARARDTVRSTGSELLQSIKQNPILVTAVGGLLGLLLVRRLLSRDTDTIVIDLKKGR
jgi:FlaA1/EpsC-like NDP-sugar epimerase